MALHMYTAIYNHALDAHEIRDDLDAIRQVAKSGLHDARQWLQRLPFKRGEVPLSAAPHLEETLFNYYHRGEYDEWWAQECNDQTPYWDRHADIPCLITGGWYDPFVDACTGYFQAMKERIEAPVRLIIGPWAHGTMRVRTTALGEVDFGPEAMLGYPAHHELRKRWFDRWLLDEANGVEDDAAVEIFVMGGSSGCKTSDGLLDHGGSIAHLAEIDAPDKGWDEVPPFGERAAVYGGQGSQIVPWGPMDQREHLYPANEDYPDGFALNLTDTVLRMRYSDSWTDPAMMEPGQVYPITITLPTTANLFQTGHRIRVDIASSNFPRLEVNPNTGEPVGRHTATIIATNHIHTGGGTPSHIALPVIPR